MSFPPDALPGLLAFTLALPMAVLVYASKKIRNEIQNSLGAPTVAPRRSR